ncbi:unnamed protein product [Hermetia illucens]|uniref:Uncharacterized protein n=1 Tax=Hermetia illucens TaxID=343691 RepID=A0A7R8V2P6_HERIL|nr:uncharacterized protein LOC119658492 [Hermetia illucens]CAD7091658.1 unnamed protein product [Hermetia illucens]
MVRLTIVILLATIAIATARSVEKETQPLSVKISTVEDINLFRAQNPTEVLTPLKRVDTKNIIYYTVGNRVSGDALVATASDSQQWSSAQNVQLLLQYPRSGQGAVVTYAIVTVDQSSSLGEAYIVSGGVGKRNIAIVVEARSTTYFRYAAQVYGL